MTLQQAILDAVGDERLTPSQIVASDKIPEGTFPHLVRQEMWTLIASMKLELDLAKGVVYRSSGVQVRNV